MTQIESAQDRLARAHAGFSKSQGIPEQVESFTAALGGRASLPNSAPAGCSRRFGEGISVKPNAKLRLLKLVARHFLRCDYCYEQVCSIIWFRNDDLGCDARLVRDVTRQAMIEDLAERNRQWEAAQ